MPSKNTRINASTHQRLKQFLGDTQTVHGRLFQHVDIVSAGVEMWLNKNEKYYRQAANQLDALLENRSQVKSND